MALARRSGARFESTIWPGFVDALTALLLILMFVLSIFMIVQFSLREQITGQDEEIDTLEQELANLSNILAIETTRADDLAEEAEGLQAEVDAGASEVNRLEAALSAMVRERDDIAARRDRLESSLDEAVSAREALAASLAAARAETDEATEAARLAAARREAMEALIAEMRTEAERLEAADAAKTATLDRTENQRLAALARVEALERANEAARRRAEGATGAIAARDRALARLATLEDEKIAALDRLSTMETEKLRALERAEAAESALTEAEEARLVEAAAARALRQKLAENADELDAVTLALEAARKEAEETLTLLAAAEAAKARLEDQSADIDDADTLRRLAEAELANAKEQTLAEQRRVALLNAQVRELRAQLGALQALLDDAGERDEAQQVQITDLGQKLNQALAQKVSDLARFRSVFFEKMDQVLGGRDDIQRVGDRFVFQSEVLFDPGSATLGAAGRDELAKLGRVLREVADSMPDDLDWILRVDGHTDRVPLRGTGRYRDNWELSQGRALSVVNYLIEQEGVPPERLAAAGFGEYQPIASGDGPDVLAQNRRIEFKFTER